MDITSDGSVIRWQHVSIGETSEDHSIFDSLWQNELIRIGSASYQISSQEVSQSERDEFHRKRANDERRKYEQEQKKREQESNKRAQIRASRRAAGRCELCGRKIWSWSFGVARHPDYLFHKKCSASLDGPINL
jgi:hypothetical protein